MNLLQEAFAAHQSGRLQDAQRLYREFIRANPDHAEAHHLLGVACMQMGNLPGAIEALTQATLLNDKNPNYFNNLGLAQFYRNDPESARANYQRALALAPKNADTLNNLGMAQQRLDDLNGRSQASRPPFTSPRTNRKSSTITALRSVTAASTPRPWRP